MEITSMHSYANSKNTIFNNKNLKFSGAESKTKKNDKNQKQDPMALNDAAIDDHIKSLRERIENIQSNDKLSIDSKKAKIETINNQIKELEELKRQRSAEELAKAMNGNKSDEEKQIENKAKERRKELEKRAQGLTDVGVGISEEGFMSLIKSGIALEHSKSMRNLKAKKSVELKRAEIELENDKELREGISNTLRNEQIKSASERIKHEAKKEFEDKYGTMKDFTAGIDVRNREERGKAMVAYMTALKDFTVDKIKEYINSEDFNSQFKFSGGKKAEYIAELQAVIDNLEKASIRQLAKANKEANKVNTVNTKPEDENLEDVKEEIVDAIKTDVVETNTIDIDATADIKATQA